MDSQAPDVVMSDAADANSGFLTEAELEMKFPNRPRNFGTALPFRELYEQLFNPLSANRRKPGTRGPPIARKKIGPHGPIKVTPQEERRTIIGRFIARWREHVGNDIYPAFRLIIPDKDRDRPMYGLKEKAIGKMLVKVLRIDRHSEDAQSLLNFKLPGQGPAARAAAGDFAGRCYEVIRRRPLRTAPTDMTIDEVNEQLDQLATEGRESGQTRIFERLYARMNATDLMWVIRMILRQMKIGATERTIFEIWHPDASSLYNVSSSLRRVCWELYDPEIRLENEAHDVALMSCFQPQLAQFQISTGFDRMVERLRPVPGDDAFWIEEKLDGERMQMHMIEDKTQSGGRRFAFWSRKAKEYTYLYGEGLSDSYSALTRHLHDAFADGVENLIVDGEMITWDPAQDKMVPFGTLKTAAIAEQQRTGANTEEEDGPRPLFALFDILLLNDKVLTGYTLRDRRAALEAAIRPVHRRLEIHPYLEAHSAAEIEPEFRRVVENEAEGLVLKNPRSAYRLNARIDDWMKVKPDYLGFGETPDCIVIGGYYGSGRRGGNLSSFLCGLVVGDFRGAETSSGSGHDPQLCWSFCRVGGGMTAQDYSEIRHRTDGKWISWDTRKPPNHVVVLPADGSERPDVWIRPADSVVLEIQAASVAESESFRVGYTLRFPRFKRLRNDKSWTDALTVRQFFDMKQSIESAAHERKLEFAASNAARRASKRPRTQSKKELRVQGAEADGDEGPEDAELKDPTTVFAGLSFYIITGGQGRTKPGLEALVKAHRGRIVQTAAAGAGVVCVADRNVVHAAALARRGRHDILKPLWLLDSISMARADRELGNVKDEGKAGDQDAIEGSQFLLLRPEPERHLLHATASTAKAPPALDPWGDSYARNSSLEELRSVLSAIEKPPESVVRMDLADVRRLIHDRGVDIEPVQQHGNADIETKGHLDGMEE